MERSDQPNKKAEHWTCPVCMEVAKGKVLQCREGHTLCEKCYSQLTICPQCRLPFGEEPIRNRAVEEMLDKLSFKCPYNSSGCAEKLDRKSFDDHVKMCHFNFAKLIHVCKNVGISSSCDFKVSRRNVREMLEHFKTAHKVVIYENFKSTSFKLKKFTSRRSPGAFLVLNPKGAGYGFLVLITVETEAGNNYLAWKTFYWRYPAGNGTSTATDVNQPVPFKVELSLAGEGESTLTWTVPPVDIMRSDDPTFQPCSMKMPGYLLVNAADTLNGGIKILSTLA